MCAYGNCRNEFLVIINGYIEFNPTVRGLSAYAFIPTGRNYALISEEAPNKTAKYNYTLLHMRTSVLHLSNLMHTYIALYLRVSLKELTVSDFHRDMYEEGDFTFQVRSVPVKKTTAGNCSFPRFDRSCYRKTAVPPNHTLPQFYRGTACGKLQCMPTRGNTTRSTVVRTNVDCLT